MRRVFFAAVLMFSGTISAASGEAAQLHVGITRFSVADAAPFDVLVWYPTEAEEVPWRTGPFVVPASRDAAVAPGRFPIVLLSHGGDRTGGSPLIRRELFSNLARQGVIVVAPFHGKTGVQGRPFQVKLALGAVLADARFTSHVDPTRLAMCAVSRARGVPGSAGRRPRGRPRRDRGANHGVLPG